MNNAGPNPLSSLLGTTESQKQALSGALGDLLSSMGIAPAEERTEAEAAVASVLKDRGHTATIVELRWGRLILEASPASARLLRIDLEMIEDQLRWTAPEAVEKIEVRVQRHRC